MCQALLMPAGHAKQIIESMGEIRALWPTLVQNHYYMGGVMESSPDDSCMCPVDIEASAAANGARVRRMDCGDYELLSE